jgi:hypothetical protein
VSIKTEDTVSNEQEFGAVGTREAGTATRRGTVYIVQSTEEGLGRFHKAARYGDFMPIMQRDTFADNAEERMPQMREVMKAKLAEFNPSRDYVLLTGDPLAIAMCILTLSCSTLSIPCLKWDRDEQDYYPVTVSV